MYGRITEIFDVRLGDIVRIRGQNGLVGFWIHAHGGHLDNRCHHGGGDHNLRGEGLYRRNEAQVALVV